jgi:alpha-tubulin suppressor-like RCC1 family protein
MTPNALPVGSVLKPASANISSTLIAAGFYHNCAVDKNITNGREMFCWGKNTSGQLGNGTITDTTRPNTTTDQLGQRKRQN